MKLKRGTLLQFVHDYVPVWEGPLEVGSGSRIGVLNHGDIVILLSDYDDEYHILSQHGVVYVDCGINWFQEEN